MIKVDHLEKKYGSHTAVRDLNLAIEPGRIYGFLGPNGAGKSTTMNIITGYLGATRGTVTINGHDIFREPEEAKKHIGYLPESPPLYPDMKVGEYLGFAAELKALDGGMRARYVEEAEEMAGIADVRGRLIRNLSKGYRQRVGLAQAILGYPDTIILDEPTIGLDPAQIIEMRDLIRELGKEHTVVLSSHILSEVRETCDYIFIMSRGRLVASDTTENLIGRFGGEGRELRLLIRGDADGAAGLLATVRGVDRASIAVDGAGETGVSTVTFRAVEGRDIRNAVIKKLVRKNCEILELGCARKTLEEIFLDLVSSDGPEDGLSDAPADGPEDGLSDAPPDGPEEAPEDGDGADAPEQTPEPVAEDVSDQPQETAPAVPAKGGAEE
jgi:ABC-2 type transport system ATP-binding protein